MVGGGDCVYDVRLACVSASRPEQNNITYLTQGASGSGVSITHASTCPSAKHGQLELHVAQGR